MTTIDKSLPYLPTVSASKIKVYKTCARQYKYKYILPFNDRPIDDKNVAALLGTALHKALELKYTDKNVSEIQVFQQVMEETITDWESKHFKINFMNYYSTALKVGTDILRKTDWDQFNPIALEQAFTLPFPNAKYPLVNLTGFIDMIDIDGSVIDHKSKSTAPAQDELDHDPQFILYAWAYEQIYNDKPYRVIWNHLRTQKLYVANVLHNYDDKIHQLTEDIIAMLKSKHHARRSMDKVCKSECSFYTLCYGDKAPLIEDSE